MEKQLRIEAQTELDTLQAAYNTAQTTSSCAVLKGRVEAEAEAQVALLSLILSCCSFGLLCHVEFNLSESVCITSLLLISLCCNTFTSDSTLFSLRSSLPHSLFLCLHIFTSCTLLLSSTPYVALTALSLCLGFAELFHSGLSLD